MLLLLCGSGGGENACIRGLLGLVFWETHFMVGVICGLLTGTLHHTFDLVVGLPAALVTLRVLLARILFVATQGTLSCQAGYIHHLRSCLSMTPTEAGQEIGWKGNLGLGGCTLWIVSD